MKKLLKFLAWAIALFVVAGLVYLGFRPKVVEVDIGEVVSGPLQVTVDEDGETRIREPYLISAPLAGRLLRVELEPGDPIQHSQVLAAIDPGAPGLLDDRSRAEAEARVKAAEANHQRAVSQVEIAEAEVEKSKRYLLRDQGRFETGMITQPMLEDTRHALRVANGNWSAAKSALDVAKFELDQAKAALVYSKGQDPESNEPSGVHFEIKSPIDGTVLRRFQESSTVIPAGERILEIGDPEDLEIKIDVLSQDAVKIQPGQIVIIEHWGGEENLRAHVRRVEPSAFTKISALGVDEQRVWVFADFAEAESNEEGSVDDSTGSDQKDSGPAALGDAYRIEARIIVWEKDEVIKVPAGALFREGDSWAVYVFENDQAKMRMIEVGQNNGIEAEVLDGLVPGDRVVLHPGDRVSEGAVIQEREG